MAIFLISFKNGDLFKRKNPFSNEERIYGNIQKQSQKIKYFDSLFRLMNVKNKKEWFEDHYLNLV